MELIFKSKLFHKSVLVPVAVFFFFSASAFAQTPNQAPSDFRGFVEILLGLIASLIPILITLALIVFLWGMAVFILNAGSEDKRAEGKQKMIWGIIGLFVMVSIWGIIGLLTGGFGFDFAFPQLRTP